MIYSWCGADFYGADFYVMYRRGIGEVLRRRAERASIVEVENRLPGAERSINVGRRWRGRHSPVTEQKAREDAPRHHRGRGSALKLKCALLQDSLTPIVLNPSATQLSHLTSSRSEF